MMRDKNLRADGPADAAATLILAHGAGQGMDSAFMQSMAKCLARAGVQVVRFDFPYMAEMTRSGHRRAPDRPQVLERTWLDVLERVRAATAGRLLIGGKSMGGRVASQLADTASVAGLVCLGYPFHPPGRPESLRLAHLETLRTPTLICQGERDPFGSRDEVKGYRLAPAIQLYWLADGEHSFKPRKGAGRTWEDNLDEAARGIVAFIEGLGDRGPAPALTG